MRIHPAAIAFGGSALVLAGLVALLYWMTRSDANAPLVVHAAASLRVPMERITKQYEAETGLLVEVRLGGSETLLANIELGGQSPDAGDLFIPADESYVARALEKGLLAEVMPLAKMHAVLALRPGYPGKVERFADIAKNHMTLAQGNPEIAAIGMLTRERLRARGLWESAVSHTKVFTGTVNEAAAAAQLQAVDAAIVWDAVAFQYRSLTPVRLPELQDVTARLQIGVLRASRRPAEALAFARYLTAPDTGLRVLREEGFSPPEDRAEGPKP